MNSAADGHEGGHGQGWRRRCHPRCLPDGRLGHRGHQRGAPLYCSSPAGGRLMLDRYPCHGMLKPYTTSTTDAIPHRHATSAHRHTPSTAPYVHPATTSPTPHQHPSHHCRSSASMMTASTSSSRCLWRSTFSSTHGRRTRTTRTSLTRSRRRRNKRIAPYVFKAGSPPFAWRRAAWQSRLSTGLGRVGTARGPRCVDGLWLPVPLRCNI